MDGEGRPLPRSTGDDRWATVGATRRVLAVARNLASAGRLADVLTVFASDSRVQTLFTMVKGSAFDDGLHEFLSETRARIVPWRQAVRSGFDLALAASANGDLHELRAPLLLMPHGAGTTGCCGPWSASIHRWRVWPEASWCAGGGCCPPRSPCRTANR